MKTTFQIICTMALLVITPMLATAQETPDTTSSQAPGTTSPKQNDKVVGKLQAELHRTMAQLIVARSADKPDPATIEKLGKRVEQLRTRLRDSGAQSPGAMSGDRWGTGMCGNPNGPMGRGPQTGNWPGGNQRSERGPGICTNDGVCPYGNTPQGRGMQQGQGRGLGAGAAGSDQAGGMRRGRGNSQGMGYGRGNGRGNARGNGKGPGGRR